MGASLSQWLWSLATAFQAPENIVKQCKVVMLGFQGSGKTTLFYRYTTSTVLKQPETTIGFNMETVKVPATATTKALSVSLFDVGGSDCMQPLWHHFYFGIHGIVFVMDCTKPVAQTLADSKILFEKLMLTQISIVFQF